MKYSSRFIQGIPLVIRQFIKIYLLAIAVFTLFRVILFFLELDLLRNTTPSVDILRAFLMGLRFDLVISGYILIFPYVILAVLSFFTDKVTWVHKAVFWFIFILFTLAFLICAIDIPYFQQFFSRLTITALTWLDTPGFVFRMIIEEPRYWLIAVPLLIILFLFFRVLRRILLKPGISTPKHFAVNACLLVLGLGLIFLGVRGRLERMSPIRIGTAYFSNNAFLNQLGLNPNFTFVRSWLDSREERNKTVTLMDDDIAIRNVRDFLGITETDPVSPLMRNIRFGDSSALRCNVVVVMMESMTAANLQRHGNPYGLTPFLDSLTNEGYYFNNAYTSGNHTYFGLFGTLFSMPALFRQHPMKESAILHYHGMFTTLKNAGYSTIYFTNHDGQFDNVEGFFYANDCERVISKKDYPRDSVKTVMGVTDDFMFGFSIPILNELSRKNKPFFASFLTVSNHGPFYVPEYFTPRNEGLKKQVVEFADWSLRKFMKMASAQSWYRNTLFVFVADHGVVTDLAYDMSLEYNHTPLLFYGPGILGPPMTLDKMAGQIDVFPTVMGILRIPYQNNTFGIDLLRQARPYIYTNGDDRYGVIDQEWYLISRNDGRKSLYRYRHRDTRDYAPEMPDKVREMQTYAESNLQAFQYIIRTNKQ